MILTTRSWIEISKSSLAHNTASYKAIIGNGILAPVIKSNAYGHGMIQIAQLCEDDPNVDWFCVAFLSEALILRNNGVTKPILVLSYLDDDPLQASIHNIDCMVYDYHLATTLHELGKKNKKSFNIHIKVDTGLGRLGIRVEQAASIIEQITKLSHLNIRGIATHFAEAQKSDLSYSYTQLHAFTLLLEQLKAKSIVIPFIHTSNTAGTTNLDRSQTNFFRIGSGIYGLWPSTDTQIRTQKKYPEFSLRPIGSWKTRIIQIKDMPPVCYIGYERTYITTKQTRIALIPVGYYDGYDSRLSNKGIVRINDDYAHVVGRISMNMTTLDISNLNNIKVGDEVLLLGNYPHINHYAIAEQLETTNARFFSTRINPQTSIIVVP